MKMVKSLLLGSAAGIVAVAGAQAADLPVKAKPVEYVKVCSLYGAGFWYVPGTDTCLKIGSYVRVQTEFNANAGGIPIGINDAAPETAGRFDRTDTSQLAFRTRSALSVDLRTQTEYGTLRSYLEVGAQLTTGSATAADAVFFDRGFIQFAGFTAGKIRSYFDINSFAPYSYSNNRVSGDTGAAGLYGIAYTAQFGNGVTASLSLEDGGAGSNGNSLGSTGSRGHAVSNLSGIGVSNAATGGTSTGLAGFSTSTGAQTYDNAGWSFPDVVGALRIDQAWGYAQIAAALHDASGGYYTNGATAGCSGALGTITAPCQTDGHPGQKLGFAVTGGFTLNDIFGMKGDQFGMQAAYANGATGYVTRATAAGLIYSGQSTGFTLPTDGVFVNGSNVELTTTWGINGFIQHFWTPKWRTSLYGGYVEVDYGSAAAAMWCGSGVNAGGINTFAGGAGTGGLSGISGITNCNPNSSWWQVGSRTQWNPHPDLDIGVDVLYTKLNTAFSGNTVSLSAAGARPSGIYTVSDQDVLSVLFRVQRNFLP